MAGMKAKQGTLTVLAPILAGDAPLTQLRAELACIQEYVVKHAARTCGPADSQVPFAEIRSLHYARFVILEEDGCGSTNGARPSPCLLFSTQYDGTLEEHLDELIGAAAPGLLAIYQYCQGFDAAAGPDPVRLRRYLLDHAAKANVFYVGALGRSVGRIRWEAEVAEWIREYAVELAGNARDVDAAGVWREIRDRVRTRLDGEDGRRLVEAYGEASAKSAGWVRYTRRTRWLWRAIYAAVYAAPVVALGVMLMLPAALVIPLALVFVALWLRVLEEQDAEVLRRDEARRSDVAHRKALAMHEKDLAQFEDLWSQNQLTVVSMVRPSALRRRLLRAILFVVRFRARYKFTRGLLHGVPTIHFAHWLVFERGRRLLFASNYDGSWAGYLDDFIQHAPGALTAIWCHTCGFPSTRFLFWDGARDGTRFKAWTRSHQVAPAVWYSAYPQISVEEINRNTELVEGLEDASLGKPQSRERTLAWLGGRTPEDRED